MPLIIGYFSIILGLGALSALAQMVVAFYKSIPAILRTILSGIVALTGAALFMLLFPVACPYAIYKAKGKWSTASRILVSVIYVMVMVLAVSITYLYLTS